MLERIKPRRKKLLRRPPKLGAKHLLERTSKDGKRSHNNLDNGEEEPGLEQGFEDDEGLSATDEGGEQDV